MAGIEVATGEHCKDKTHPAPQLESSELMGRNTRTFSMQMELYTPSNPNKPCYECVLRHGPMCLDKTHCEFRETGKVWRKIKV